MGEAVSEPERPPIRPPFMFCNRVVRLEIVIEVAPSREHRAPVEPVVDPGVDMRGQLRPTPRRRRVRQVPLAIDAEMVAPSWGQRSHPSCCRRRRALRPEVSPCPASMKNLFSAAIACRREGCRVRGHQPPAAPAIGASPGLAMIPADHELPRSASQLDARRLRGLVPFSTGSSGGHGRQAGERHREFGPRRRLIDQLARGIGRSRPTCRSGRGRRG